MSKLSLSSVKIDGFRGLRNAAFEGLGRVNVIVGGNNSGKTSVLEALSVLCNPFDPYEWVSMTHRRDFGRLDETLTQSLRWCFTQSGELIDSDTMFEGECHLECQGDFPLRHLQITYKDIVGQPEPLLIWSLSKKRQQAIEESSLNGGLRGAEITHQISPENFRKLNKLIDTDPPAPISIQFWEDIPQVLRNRVKSPSIKTETLTPYSYQINSLQVRKQSEHIFEENSDFALQLVNEFDPNIKDIKIASFRGGRPAIYLNHENFGPAPLSIFGDALRRAVLLAHTLPSLKDGGILLIDEIETGIHVHALDGVFAWLVTTARKLNIQIVATTHSLEAVDAMVSACKKDIEDVVIYQLEQTEDETKTKRFAGDLLFRIRHERGLDVR